MVKRTKYNPKQIVAIRPEAKEVSGRFRYVPEKVTKGMLGKEKLHEAHFVDDRLLGYGQISELPKGWYLEGDKVYVKPYFIVFWTDKTTTEFRFGNLKEMEAEFNRLSGLAGLININTDGTKPKLIL